MVPCCGEQVFRPLTLRATGEVLGEVRGLLVVRINEEGLIEHYQMSILNNRVNAVLLGFLSAQEKENDVVQNQ